MRILGLSAHYHDAAAALLVDGQVVAAAQEERFTRLKHDASFPRQAAAYCLAVAGIEADDLDAIAYYEKPFEKFDRLLSGFIDESPRGFRRFVDAVPVWLSSRLWTRSEIERELDTRAPVRFVRHHESHAAAAYGPSPFSEAAVLTIDGVGEWTTNGLWHARGAGIEPLLEIRYPDSIGLLYSAFTAYCGFRVNDGEYKLMGLAPYGEPTFAGSIRDHVIELYDDGSYRLNPEHFAYRWSDTMVSARFEALFGGRGRLPDEALGRRHADLARSVQVVVEEVLLRQAAHARALTGATDLCLAGGVALNCVANGRLAEAGIFDRLWIQPAAGDAGGSLGAAYAVWLREGEESREPCEPDGQSGSLLGPGYTEDEMRAALESAGLDFERLGDDELVERTALALSQGAAVGWFQGRMEFGPRALGNRSILADARDVAMQSRVNLAIKLRESFRPFAPMVPEPQLGEWFELPCPSPYMLLVGRVRGASPVLDAGRLLESSSGMPGVESPVPAVTHVDASARVQTVARGSNPPVERLLERFGALTGCPVLLNTSFNIKDEPIVCSPTDAVRCFERTGLDRLVLGPFFAVRGEGAPSTPGSDASAPARRSALRAAADACGGGVGFFVLARVLELPVLGVVALAFGVAMATLRMAHPGAARTFDGALRRFGIGLARALAVPLLGVVFVAAVVPAGLWSRRRARRSTDAPALETAWVRPSRSESDLARPF